MLTRAVFVAVLLLGAACTPAATPTPTATPVSASPPGARETPPGSSPSPAGVPGRTAPVSPSLPASPAAGSPAAGSPSPAAATPAGTPVAAGDWTYLADFPAGEAIEVAGVTAHGDGFVAVGFEPYPGEGFGGRRNGVVWTSVDGQSWARAVPPDVGSTSLLHVVSLDGQLYAFGDYSICPELSEEEECTDAPEAGIALWRSTDAITWQRLALPESLRAGIIDGALTDGQQLIVHGSTGEDLLASVWLSPNGEQWSEVRELGGLDPINALAAGDGRLVAFGLRYLPDEDDVETLAAYSTGGAFAPAVLPGDQRGVVQDVVWSEGGFVAVGVAHALTIERPAWVALTSDDGISWTAAGTDQLPLGATLRYVLAVPAGYLALGTVPAAEAEGEQPYSWFSPDGLVWPAYGSLIGGTYRQYSSAAHGAPGAVAFATDFEPSDELEPVEPGIGAVHAWFSPLTELR